MVQVRSSDAYLMICSEKDTAYLAIHVLLCRNTVKFTLKQRRLFLLVQTTKPLSKMHIADFPL